MHAGRFPSRLQPGAPAPLFLLRTQRSRAMAHRWFPSPSPLGAPACRFLRLPSTRCEQQQFEQLMNDLDADLLMRLALGQW